MKPTQLLATIALTTGVCFLVTGWTEGQASENQPVKTTGTRNHSLVVEQLHALVNHLEATGQTNTLKLFNDYQHAAIAQQRAAEMGMTLRTLKAMREGRTDEAIQLQESKLDLSISSFAASYQELPSSQRSQLGVQNLRDARWYRSQFQLTNSPFVLRAFEMLDEPGKAKQ